MYGCGDRGRIEGRKEERKKGRRRKVRMYGEVVGILSIGFE